MLEAAGVDVYFQAMPDTQKTTLKDALQDRILMFYSVTQIFRQEEMPESWKSDKKRRTVK